MRSTRQTTCTTLLTIALVATLGCGKGGGILGALGSSAADAEAQRLLQYDSFLVKCGDTYYRPSSSGVRIPWVPSDPLTAYRGVTAKAVPAELTAADKANGVSWRGVMNIRPEMRRQWLTAERRWDEWQSFNPDEHFLIQFQVVRRGEKWETEQVISRPKVQPTFDCSLVPGGDGTNQSAAQSGGKPSLKQQMAADAAASSGITSFTADPKWMYQRRTTYQRNADGTWTANREGVVTTYREDHRDAKYLYLFQESHGYHSMFRIPLAGGRVLREDAAWVDGKQVFHGHFKFVLVPDEHVLPGQAAAAAAQPAVAASGAAPDFLHHQDRYDAADVCAALKAGVLPASVKVVGKLDAFSMPRAPCPWVDFLYVRDPDGSTWKYERGGTTLDHPRRYERDAGPAEDPHYGGVQVASYYTREAASRLPAGTFEWEMEDDGTTPANLFVIHATGVQITYTVNQESGVFVLTSSH